MKCSGTLIGTFDSVPGNLRRGRMEVTPDEYFKPERITLGLVAALAVYYLPITITERVRTGHLTLDMNAKSEIFYKIPMHACMLEKLSTISSQ
jgi:hypothetical protein